MRDEDKPFVTTRGSGSFNIVPRSRTGWLYLGLWLIPALVIALGYSWIMDARSGDSDDVVVVTMAFVAAMTVWAVAMARWMYVRSEVIDIRKLTEEKRKRKRERERGRR